MLELAMWAIGKRDHRPCELRRMFEDLGLQIDAAMRKRGMTIMDLATATKLDPHFLRAVLRGEEEDIELHDLVDIGLALGCRWKTEMFKRATTTERSRGTE